jgi:hypothetical protein
MFQVRPLAIIMPTLGKIQHPQENYFNVLRIFVRETLKEHLYGGSKYLWTLQVYFLRRRTHPSDLRHW